MNIEKEDGFCRLPLFAHMLNDKDIGIVSRAIDMRWIYTGLLISKFVQSGFNPFSMKLYIGKFSKANDYFSLKNNLSNNSIRSLNKFDDTLVKELLFMVHDYLHLWAYRWIKFLCPSSIGFGRKNITEKNIEDFAFCHLISEAVATVGLDYWFLSTIDLDKVLKIGTRIKRLTISYDANDPEFKSISPKFNSNSPDFFKMIASFYADGQFLGFNAKDVLRSPKLHGWLAHELGYGEKQRIYARAWFLSIIDKKFNIEDKNLSKPLKVDSQWKKNLVESLSKLLWEKVTENKILSAPIDNFYDPTIKKGIADNIDMRFCNFNQLNSKEKKIAGIKNEYYYSQLFLGKAFSKSVYLKYQELPSLIVDKRFKTLDLISENLEDISPRALKREPKVLFMLP